MSLLKLIIKKWINSINYKEDIYVSSFFINLKYDIINMKGSIL